MDKSKALAIKNFVEKEYNTNEMSEYLSAGVHLIGYGLSILKSASVNKKIKELNKKMVDELIEQVGF